MKDKIATLILLIILAICSAATIYIATIPKIGERFTEFYILGPGGKAYGYPTRLKYGENGSVIIGISNHEYRTVNYTVVVRFGNSTIWTKNLVLEHNQTWEGNFTFKATKHGKNIKLEFLLYIDRNFTKPYRELHLWVDVT